MEEIYSWYSGGLVGLIILILDLIAIFEVLQTGRRPIFNKLLWILFILVFPVFGLIVYLLFSNRYEYGNYEAIV
ncbi:hypothetical protein Glove_712g27 [Diversispora epigaea]|uniref:Cardiolipin synthase N-terminal domain-containing protein n=1 Tax=Diversispora epigaea TaxID=1348612 RepID=A0A397G9C0_9GLOM|nr:hypothetical protein Glove_712g27 [Diversispora epigaea]